MMSYLLRLSFFHFFSFIILILLNDVDSIRKKTIGVRQIQTGMNFNVVILRTQFAYREENDRNMPS